MRGDDAEPGVVEPELDAVALEPDDELFPRPDTYVLAARGEVTLGRGDEAVALLLELAPAIALGEELLEGADGEPVLPNVRQDARWRSSSGGGASRKRSRLERFDSSRSCTS